MSETETKRITHQKTTVLSRAGWILLTLAFLTVIVLDAFFSDTGILNVWRFEQELRVLSVDIQALEGENSELQSMIDDLRTNPEAVEWIAREELEFAKPGEDVYLFPEAWK